MNDIVKHRLQRWLQRLGIRLESARYAKFSYDACNFALPPGGGDTVIFDVGANIGQTSLWFSTSFPHATIYAFEPFKAVFDRLQAQFPAPSRVHCVNCALGKADGSVTAGRVSNPLAQCNQVVAAMPGAREVEEIKMRSVDSFCLETGIQRLFILKTDTEGYDLDVLRGAQAALRSGCVTHVLSEASIRENDPQHTSFFALREFLEPLNFELHGLYDLFHNADDGRLEYFNVIFSQRSAQPTGPSLRPH
jgi:FkbM family methyltransferase